MSERSSAQDTGEFNASDANPAGEVVPPPLPVAPPTVQGEVVKMRIEPVWPTVIGIISIIFGVGGVLVSIYGALMFLIFDSVMGMGAQPEEMTHAVEKYVVWSSVSSALGIPIAALLLTGGILLLKKRPIAPTLLVWWSILRIFNGLMQAAIAALMQSAQFEAIGSSGAGAPMAGMGQIIAIVTLILSAGWASALPVFMLIWFSREKVRAVVASWRIAQTTH